MEGDLVLCAIGSHGGRSRPWLSSVTTLGSWEAACGKGVAVKVSRRGETGQGSCTGQDVRMAEARIGVESKLVLERECLRAARDWPPLEAPGWAPLDVPGTGCGPGWGAVDQDGATLQRDHVDWQWPQPG